MLQFFDINYSILRYRFFLLHLIRCARISFSDFLKFLLYNNGNKVHEYITRNKYHIHIEILIGSIINLLLSNHLNGINWINVSINIGSSKNLSFNIDNKFTWKIYKINLILDLGVQSNENRTNSLYYIQVDSNIG